MTTKHQLEILVCPSPPKAHWETGDRYAREVISQGRKLAAEYRAKVGAKKALPALPLIFQGVTPNPGLFPLAK